MLPVLIRPLTGSSHVTRCCYAKNRQILEALACRLHTHLSRTLGERPDDPRERLRLLAPRKRISPSLVQQAPRSTLTSDGTTRRQPTPSLFTMKLDTPEFHALFTPELLALIDIFQRHGYELRVAGGAVRDLLLGRQPQDVDFATTATPAEMKEMFEKENIRMLNTKGERHGTITCRMMDKENFEVTTLRIDVVTDGRHAEVEFTRDWELDALRRDLTINSMFLGFDGTLYDYFNGYADLQQKKVQFVGNADDRIKEDYLRILRYFRFYGRIVDTPKAHDPSTLDSIRHNVSGLAGISGERIWMELRKILCGAHADAIVRVMIELGMAAFIGLPETCNLEELDRVWERCKDLNPQSMTLLAALLQQEQEVYKFNERMKMSREELRLGTFIINHRTDNPGDEPLRHYKELLCDTVGKEPKVKDKICELLKYTGQREVLEPFIAWEMPRFPVSGHRLLEVGVPKGPPLAKALAGLRQIWKESGFTLTEEQLMAHSDKFKS